ncbi:uncharacterized protein LOC110696413 [Chenopodium quinoa]|uniref:uncharacterized protein LOC110696413 n=1 Tax=Chenopodium quinoa TaxID=63459 RepID=UPI000B7919BD|nr:uncharacterized protein LOC110696413 [Chenopodium quinoa]
MVEDPKELWDCLNERFGHHKRVLLPKALFDWTNLRFQDFKSVIDYNSTIHEIVSILRYCDHPVTDEQMIEKTLTTFHASNILLQEQYRERGFKKFNELMSKGQLSGSHKQTPSKGKDTCYRCGMTGHWGRTCRTAKHLVDLYQASVKGKEKNAEANYVNEENAPCPSLDVSDYFMDN